MQGGRCAICQRATGRGKRLAVDHNHATGEVRGLLCKPCNRDVLGHLRDDVSAFERAIVYLTDPPARRMLSGSDGHD
ncbi:endonuclease VII domain-containing protein [Actinocrispum wychmicini]|uniref:endonuclease VII domain-containing protein n=1 Tax=Actinocrispum wychmicini TaxID=1213861 RepID=UPI003C7CD269